MALVGNTFTTGSKVPITIGNEQLTLELHETLGVGSFGVVSRAVDQEGRSYALKSISCRDSSTYETISEELYILLSLKHPNIVTMHGFDFLNDTAILAMEYCSEGTLNRRLDEGEIDVVLQLQWMDQLTTALTYLHDNNIVHRDLKTDNILLCHGDLLKIADFGVARHFVSCRRGVADNSPDEYISGYLESHMGTFAGTPFWIAPEVFDHKYAHEADVFSLGVIFHSICERQCCVYEGDRYYGTFTEHKGNQVGLGFAMYEQQQLVPPLFVHTTHDKLKETIASMVHFCPELRRSLIDVRVGLSEVYCEVLQVHDDTPPVVMETAELLPATSASATGVFQSFCCCFRERKRYDGYNQLL